MNKIFDYHKWGISTTTDGVLATKRAEILNRPEPCQYCGAIHNGFCPRIKKIEYHPDGAIKAIEFTGTMINQGQGLVGYSGYRGSDFNAGGYNTYTNFSAVSYY